MPVLEIPERPFWEVDHVGVAIRLTDHGMHSGILYRLDGEAPRILHLAFHCMLTDEEAAHPYRWADIGLDEDNKIVLAAQLSRIAHAKPAISYGFDADGMVFDPLTGEILPAPAGKGLTCATFIVAALKTYGYEFIDTASWPERAEDRAWEDKILQLLSRYASSEHVEAVRTSDRARRLRPGEVVGSATVAAENWPVEFEQAVDLAAQICVDLAA